MLPVGVIGIQGYGRTSLNALRKRGDVSVAALCDVDEAGARRLAGEHGVPGVFTDYQEMLAAGVVEAVVVATPHFLHRPMTLDALGAGVHVFCEKPLALDADEAREMADAARAAGLVLSCNYSKRQSYPVRALQAAVRSGVLGDCYHLNARWSARWTGFLFSAKTDWRTDPEKSGGGILIGRGSHLIDAALHVLGEPKVASVYAVLQNRLTGFAVEDFAQATLRLETGATVHVDCSYVLPTPSHRERQEFELFGTRGGAFFSQSDDQPPTWQVGTLDLADGQWRDVTASVEVTGSVPSPLDSFIDAILRRTPLAVTADAAAYVSEVLSAGYESARLGREVTLPVADGGRTGGLG